IAAKEPNPVPLILRRGFGRHSTEEVRGWGESHSLNLAVSDLRDCLWQIRLQERAGVGRSSVRLSHARWHVFDLRPSERFLVDGVKFGEEEDRMEALRVATRSRPLQGRQERFHG